MLWGGMGGLGLLSDVCGLGRVFGKGVWGIDDVEHELCG